MQHITRRSSVFFASHPPAPAFAPPALVSLPTLLLGWVLIVLLSTTAQAQMCCVPDSVAPCTTSCGTQGTQGCDASGCPLGCEPPNEACNGFDDNCDGVIDEGFDCVLGETQPCQTSCDVEGRTSGRSTCEAGCSYGECVPPAEVCNGLDDNCDGVVDEGFDCGVGDTEPCIVPVCGVVGSRTCDDTCSFGACLPHEELCAEDGTGNLVDDDCDGEVDEGCLPPPPEECNGIDDDLDGLIDEDFACAQGERFPILDRCGDVVDVVCGDDCMPQQLRLPEPNCPNNEPFEVTGDGLFGSCAATPASASFGWLFALAALTCWRRRRCGGPS